MSMFLTDAELRELTDAGTTATQKAWLDQHGWTYTVSRMNKVKVLRAYTEQRMGMGKATAGDVEPDWSHWNTA